MSHELINRSADLKRLRDEGYDILAQSGYLLVRDVPYVNSSCEIRRGTLITVLTLANNITTTPDNHVILFAGEYPCNKDGTPIEQIRNASHQGKQLADGVKVDHRFSAKPPSGNYSDYYDKVTAYVRILSGPAEALDSTVTAKTFPLIRDTDENAIFRYIDTASSRAEIVIVNKKIQLGRIAIIGLGGTGAYVLDLVSKSPVKEILLIDGDRFLQHNAFRSPGAASQEDLEEGPLKVDYFAGIYGRMRTGIIPHASYIERDNLHLLHGTDFVFLCFDNGPAKKAVIESLLANNIPFADVGMGLDLIDDSITGLLRVTTSTAQRSNHISEKLIPFAAADGDNEYATNIQIADLNALNAALAVVRWKKVFGFYLDLEREHHTVYAVNGNELTNEERA